MLHLNNKQNKNATQSSADRITTSLSLAHKRKNKQRLSTNLTLYKAHTNHWTNLRRTETKKKREFNLFQGNNLTFLEAWENKNSNTISSVQSLSCVQFFVTPWTAAFQASLSITNFRSLPKFMSIESVMPSSHLMLCRPLLLLPSIFPSIRVFSNESAFHIRWPKYWSLSFNISRSNEHSELISFRMDWLDLLVVQGTLKSLLQHQY